MYPNGIIYQRGRGTKRHGEVVLIASAPVILLYSLIRGIAVGLISFSVIVFLFTWGPVIRDEIAFRARQFSPGEVQRQQAELTKLAEAREQAEVRKETESLGIGAYFSVYVPKIDAKANIIPNVDAANEKEYLAALGEGVAHARGTYFPGQGRRIFLFAHSTDSIFNVAKYNAVFFLLNKLEKGDMVVVFFGDKKYKYVVREKVVVKPSDVSWISPGETEELVLQTCTPAGTTWRRLLVVATPEGS